MLLSKSRGQSSDLIRPEHHALACLLILFPVPYALDLNFLGGLSARGLESPLPRLYTGTLLIVAIWANFRVPRFSGFFIFGVVMLLAAYSAFALGIGPSPDLRSVISLSLVIALSIGRPANYAAALASRKVKNAFVATSSVCLLDAIRETVSPVFVASNIDFSRVSGGFSHPNAFALFLVALLCAVLSFLKRSKAKYFCGSAIFLSICATKSLSAFTLLAIAFIVRSGVRSWKFPAALLLVILVVVVLLSGFLPFSRAEELRSALIAMLTFDSSGIDYGSLQWRLAVWHENVSLMRSAGLTGYGMGSFADVSGVGNLAHNVYVQLTVESGFIGLTSYILSLVLVGFSICKGRSKAEGIAIWLVLVIAGFSLNVLNYSAAVCLLVYLCIAFSQRRGIAVLRSKQGQTGASKRVKA